VLPASPVKSADDGVPMAEVAVTLVDESTGSVKTASTNADGSFVSPTSRSAARTT
jgi:5-hydroxyisourate hydrolase-like protein (transthyretin family)